MLDTKQSWDDLVAQHAPDEQTRDAILANPLYQNITGRFVQSHDYIAMERLYEIHSSGRYDLIVVDTPPTRNAIDFLEAPERMADFFSSRLLRWLIAPYRSRIVQRGLAALLRHRRPHPGQPVPPGHRRVLHPVPDDVRRVRGTGPGRHPHPGGQADHLRGRLHPRVGAGPRGRVLHRGPVPSAEFHLGALVLNKVLAPVPAGRRRRHRCRSSCAAAQPRWRPHFCPSWGLRPGAEANLPRPPMWPVSSQRWPRASSTTRVVAQREAEQAAELGAVPELVATVPYFDHDLTDLSGLLELGAAIWR